LVSIDEAWLRERCFGPAPEAYGGHGDEADFQYHWTNLLDLRSFFETAAGAGRAVVFTVDQ